MSVDIQEEQRAERRDDPGQSEAVRPSLGQRLRQAPARFQAARAQINWRITLLTALVMAVGWCLLFLANNILQILAGVVPVVAGLFLGRRVKQQLLLHGIILGVGGFLIGLLLIIFYGVLGSFGLVTLPTIALEQGQPAMQVTPGELIFFYVSFSLFALLPFPAFGTVMSGRAEERNRELRRQLEERGGRLERPGVVRTLEDLRGLSLPQLGSYTANLFKRKGFDFKDYRFIDKDKHLDIELSYKDETYLLRLSVADKVRPGTIESLVQDMKRREIPKGIVITSTEFTADALKSAKGKRNILAVDGQTLFDMAEN